MGKKKAEIEEVSQETKEKLVSLRDVLDGKTEYEVKKYLPIETKMIMIDSIIESCTNLNEDEMLVINYALKYLSLRLAIAVNFSNLDCSAFDSVTAYNMLEESGIIQDIIDRMESEEVKFMDDILEYELRQKDMLHNTIDGIINRAVNRLISKIPEAKDMEKMIKQINKFDPEKLQMIKSMTENFNGNKTK